MATRGDLYIKTKDGNGREETNRYLITGDAYIGGAGMRSVLKEAIEFIVENGEDIPLANALICSRPEMFVLNNEDREGGHFYRIDARDLLNARIEFGYNLGPDAWSAEEPLTDFLNSKSVAADYEEKILRENA